MGERRQARELALQALCYIDMHGGESAELLEEFCNNFLDDFSSKFKESSPGNIKTFFLDVVEGVLVSKGEIDSLINQFSKNWKLFRMPVVDRNIMRMAVYELMKRDDIPSSVSINEAVDIGKKFGTRGSGSFINGVLDRISIHDKIK